MVVGGKRADPNGDFLPLHFAGRAAGRISSMAYSPRLERNVALAMVATGLGQGGLRVTLEDGSQRDVAVVGEDWGAGADS